MNHSRFIVNFDDTLVISKNSLSARNIEIRNFRKITILFKVKTKFFEVLLKTLTLYNERAYKI